METLEGYPSCHTWHDEFCSVVPPFWWFELNQGLRMAFVSLMCLGPFFPMHIWGLGPFFLSSLPLETSSEPINWVLGPFSFTLFRALSDHWPSIDCPLQSHSTPPLSPSRKKTLINLQQLPLLDGYTLMTSYIKWCQHYSILLSTQIQDLLVYLRLGLA